VPFVRALLPAPSAAPRARRPTRSGAVGSARLRYNQPMADASSSSWQVVLDRIERFEQALAVAWLFEQRDAELLANGESLASILDVEVASERGVADLLATRMRALEGGDWSYTDFYGPSRGALQPAPGEVRALVQRCADAGVRLHYDDGSEAAAVCAPAP